MQYQKLIHEAIKNKIERLCVGAVIKENKKILVLKRSANDFMPGIYELPSGKIEELETLEEALKREVKEETNLKVTKVIKYLGHFDYLSKSGNKTRQLNFEVCADGKVKLSKEHDDFRWATKSSKLNITDEVRKIIKY